MVLLYIIPSQPTSRFLKCVPEDQKIVSWINLLNFNDHFNPITKPARFFGTHYWCQLCNKCFHDKQEHKCIPSCVACKTLDTENCQLWRRKKAHCNDCQRDFFGDTCLANHKSVTGKINQLYLGVCFTFSDVSNILEHSA